MQFIMIKNIYGKYVVINPAYIVTIKKDSHQEIYNVNLKDDFVQLHEDEYNELVKMMGFDLND